MFFVLGKEHCLDVMASVHASGWSTASEVARDLNIHIATAVKYLSELNELELLKRRTRKGKTREAFEYRTKSSRIRVEVDLRGLNGDVPMEEDSSLTLFSILFLLLEKSRKVVGVQVDKFVHLELMELIDGHRLVLEESLKGGVPLTKAQERFREVSGMWSGRPMETEMAQAISQITGSISGYIEQQLGPKSAHSIVDATMKKISVGDNGNAIPNGIIDSLPEKYFSKWRED